MCFFFNLVEREGEGVRVGGEEGESAGTMGGREGVWRVEGGGGLLTAGGLCSTLGHWVLGSSSPQEKSGSESVDSCYPCSSAKHKHHTCTYIIKRHTFYFCIIIALYI